MKTITEERGTWKAKAGEPTRCKCGRSIRKLAAGSHFWCGLCTPITIEHIEAETRNAIEPQPERNRMDLSGALADYEAGLLDFSETVDLFQRLINNGMAWTLQGHYGRTAESLIDSGYCEPRQ